MKYIKNLKVLLVVMLFIVMSFPNKAFASSITGGDIRPTNPISVSSSYGESGSKSFKTDQFDITITIGLRGIITNDNGIVISVQITNKKDDFEGTLRTYARGDSAYLANIVFEKNISIAKGETKIFSGEAEYTHSGTQRMGLQILDSNGTSVFSDSFTANSIHSNVGVIGLLTEKASAINYFLCSEIEIDYYENIYTSTLKLKAKDMPSTADPFTCLSILIISDFDTSQLSKEQYEAIKDWVINDGGVLIIGTGKSASETLSIFNQFDDDFLNVTMNGAVSGTMTIAPPDTEEELEELKEFNNGQISFTEEDGIQSISVEGAETLNGVKISYDEELGLIQRKQIGTGNVVVTGFNLGADVIRSLKWKDYFGSVFLNEIIPDDVRSYFLNSHGGFNLITESHMLDVTDNLLELQLPNIVVYAILFISYLVFLGIVGYLILKKMKKTNWMWGLITVTSIAFTVFIIIFSSSSQIKGGMVSQFTIMEVKDEFIDQKMFVEVKTSSLNSYTIQIDSTYSDFKQIRSTTSEGFTDLLHDLAVDYLLKKNGGSISNSDYPWLDFFQEGDNSFRYTLKTNENGYQLVTSHTKSFTSDYMLFEGERPKENTSFDIQITEATETNFAGSVTNNTGYDLKESFICCGSVIVYIGDFKNGDTKTFTKADCIKIEAQTFSSEEIIKYVQATDILKENIENTYSYVCVLHNRTLSPENGTVFGYIDDLKEYFMTNENIRQNAEGLIFQKFDVQAKDVQEN